MRRLPAAALVLTLAAAGAAPAGAQASFQGLGDLPGGAFSSQATAASADGAVVVGASDAGGGESSAFRWTAAGGMVDLGDLTLFGAAAGEDRTRGGLRGAHGVSQGGDAVVGTSTNGAGAPEAWRWMAATGIVGIGFLTSNDSTSLAEAVSADGSVVVGASPNAAHRFEAFRWTSAGGMGGLGFLPGGDAVSVAESITPDGNLVVGGSASVSTAGFATEAFRWTAAGGMVALGDLPGGTVNSVALAVSADGQVIVGAGTSANGGEAFLWTQAGGIVGLGDLPSGTFDSRALAVSADGSVVVGRGNSASGSEALIWTAPDGMQRLRDVLVAQGVDMTGWTLRAATGVSADGRVIVGEGNNPQGQTEAWRAVLPPGGHRWIDPTGGSWDVASNWEPATVPGPNDRVRFDIPGTYTVTGGPGVGPRSVLGLHANNGTIDYELDNLVLVAVSLTDPSLAVSADAIAKIISGSSEMVDATIGFDDNPAGDTTTVARLQVFNAGTTLVGTGDVLVGGGGGTARGEVFVAAGELRSRNGLLGGLSIGEAFIGNDGEWTVNENLTVGFAAPGRLSIENGGRVIASSVTVGQFTEPPDQEGLLVVTGSSASRRSQLVVFDTLVVARQGVGRLRVRDGAIVTTGHMAVGLDSLEGSVSVEGQGGGISSEVAATSISVGHGGALVFHRMDIRAGGLVTAGSLRVGRTATFGSVQVEGSAGDSFLAVNGLCTIEGIVFDLFQSALRVSGAGAQARCLSGIVLSGGSIDLEDIGKLTVRGVLNIENGDLNLDQGFLDAVDVNGTPTADAADVVVLPPGSISGIGFLVGTIDASGPVSVGVIVIPPPRDGAPTGERRGTPGGTLEVSGRVILRPSAFLDFALAGPDSTSQGRLRVRARAGFPTLDGSAALDGTLRLIFSDGYAPQTGDTFELLDAASTTGTFASVEVTGLEPGWLFEITIVNGTVVLNSLSDGVPTTPAEPGAPAPAGLVLHAPAPNPTGGSTTLRYDLPAAGRVRLALYDALGREVAVLVDGERPAGAHEATLRAGALAPGVYVVRLTAGAGAAARRLTIVR